MSKLHHEIKLPAPPEAVYAALAQSSLHAAFTGEAAEIGEGAGSHWSAYGGKISGINIELVPDRRIVQTWRAGNWPEGAHSLVRFELQADGDGTTLSLDHDAIPEGMGEHLDGGWKQMYWGKLRAFFG